MKKLILIITSLCLFISLPSFALTELEKTEESLTYFNYFLTQAESAKVKNNEAVFTLKMKALTGLLTGAAVLVLSANLHPDIGFKTWGSKAAFRIRAITPFTMAFGISLIGAGIFQVTEIDDSKVSFSAKTAKSEVVYEKLMESCLQGTICDWGGRNVKEEKEGYKKFMDEFLKSQKKNSNQEYKVVIKRSELRDLIKNLKNLISTLKKKKEILSVIAL